MSTPVTKPRRKRATWLILIPIILLAAVGLGLAIPDSPIYLPKVFELEMRIEDRSRSEWVKDLKSDDVVTRLKAVAALGQMNTGGKKALPDLLRVMQTDPDGEVRSAAAGAVGKMYPAADAAGKMYPPQEAEKLKAEYAALVLEPFTTALSDPDKRVRYNAVVGLLKLKDKARPAVPAIKKTFEDPENDTNLNMFHSTIRQAALRALGEAAAGTPDGVPTFAAVLAIKLVPPGPEGTGRAGQGGKASQAAVDASLKFVEGRTDRRHAVAGLGLAGEHGRPYAPQIRELLKSQYEDDQAEAREALQRMGLPEKE
jgi:HEAT repeat protein